MIKKLFIGTTIALSALTTTALAFDQRMQMTGAAFSDACIRANESWISFCNGYAQAAIDSLRVDDGICIPPGTSRTDIVTVTERVITASSQLQTMNAHDAVRLVLRQAFPCR